MKLTSFFAVAAVVAASRAQTFQINTPGSVVQCIPTQFTFSGGSAPYTLLIQTPDANGAIEQEIDSIQSSPITWATNITATIQLGLTLRDSTGASAQSGTFIVNSGSDSSCLTDSGSATSAASSETSSAASTGSDSVSASDSATSAVSSTPASSGSVTSTSPVSSATSHASSASGASGASGSSTHASGSSTGSSVSTSASATTSSSAGMVNAASSGVVGFIGFLLAGLMA